MAENGALPTEDGVQVLREVSDEFERTENQGSHTAIQLVENSVGQSTSKIPTAMAANKSPRIEREPKSTSPKRNTAISPKKAQTLKQKDLRHMTKDVQELSTVYRDV